MPITTELIQKKVDASGLKKGYICEQLGISRVSFNNKLAGRTQFSLTEFNKLNELVKILD